LVTNGPMSPRKCIDNSPSSPFDKIRNGVVINCNSREFEDHLGPGSYSPSHTETTLLKTSFNRKMSKKNIERDMQRRYNNNNTNDSRGQHPSNPSKPRSKSAPRGGGRRRG
jgi:hypothetical protein